MALIATLLSIMMIQILMNVVLITEDVHRIVPILLVATTARVLLATCWMETAMLVMVSDIHVTV